MAVGIRGQYFKYREFSLNLLAIYKQRSDVQAFLEIILSLSTLIVFIVFAIKPTALTMVTLNKEINAKKETLNSLNQKISDLQTANNIYRENQAIVPDVDAAIFNVPQPDTISKQVLGTAAKNTVEVLGLSIGQAYIQGQGGLSQNQSQNKDTAVLPPLPNSAQSLAVSINVKADYPNLIAFLKGLEDLRIPIKIDTLTLNSTQLVSGSSLTELVSSRIPYTGK